MRNLKLKYNYPKYSDEKLNKSISSILDLNTLLSMATIKDKNESYINTVYYAYNDKLNFYYLSPPDTQHSKNLEKNSSVAVSIFDSRQNPPTINKRGLQIFGDCKLAKGIDLIDGFKQYSIRYSSILKYIKKPGDLLKKIIHSKLYFFKPASIKIFDEVTFGTEQWVTVSIK